MRLTFFVRGSFSLITISFPECRHIRQLVSCLFWWVNHRLNELVCNVRVVFLEISVPDTASNFVWYELQKWKSCGTTQSGGCLVQEKLSTFCATCVDVFITPRFPPFITLDRCFWLEPYYFFFFLSVELNVLISEECTLCIAAT